MPIPLFQILLFSIVSHRVDAIYTFTNTTNNLQLNYLPHVNQIRSKCQLSLFTKQGRHFDSAGISWGRRRGFVNPFFWVISQRLNFICQRFGIFCLFHLRTYLPMKMEQSVPLSRASEFYVPKFRNTLFNLHRRLNFICQRFGTLCLFHLHRLLNFICQRFGTLCLFNLHRLLNFICQRFGTLCLFNLHRRLNFICQRFGTLCSIFTDV